MAEGPKPSVIEVPGARVWLEMMYWDCAFGVKVSLLMVMGTATLADGVGKLRGKVVRIWEPAALVVGRIMAGRWAVEERTVPCALVEDIIVGRDADTEAEERLVERTILPCALVELMTMGCSTAVLVEIAIPPLESVDVTGIRTATGLVGSAVAGAGEGVMIMLSDTCAGRYEMSGSMSLAGSGTFGIF